VGHELGGSSGHESSEYSFYSISIEDFNMMEAIKLIPVLEWRHSLG